MAETFFRPGLAEGIPPSSPTQFSPAKPTGPDPVSPVPAGRGTDIPLSSQIYGYDPVSNLWLPGRINPATGRILVDANLTVQDIEIGAVEIKDNDTDDRLQVNPDGTINVNLGAPSTLVNVYDEAPSVPVGTPTVIVSYSVPPGNTLYLKHAEFGGQNYGVYRVKVDSVVVATLRVHDGLGLSGRIDWKDDMVPGGLLVPASSVVELEVTQNGFVVSDHEGRIYGRLT